MGTLIFVAAIASCAFNAPPAHVQRGAIGVLRAKVLAAFVADDDALWGRGKPSAPAGERRPRAAASADRSAPGRAPPRGGPPPPRERRGPPPPQRPRMDADDELAPEPLGTTSEDGAEDLESSFESLSVRAADADAADADDAEHEASLAAVAEDLADAHASPELLAIHNALRDALDRRNPSKALRLLRAAAKSDDGPPLDAQAYLLGLVACDRLQAWEVASELLNEAETRDIEPTAKMYTTALSACARAGRWQEATALLARLTTAYPATNAYPYSLVVRACAAKGEWRRTFALHDAMLAAGVRPTARACGTILSALGDCLHAGGRAGEGAGAVSGGKTTAVRKLNADQTEALERALDLLGSMPEWGVRVDSFAAMAAIRIFAATHDAESALNLIRVMRDEHTATLDEWRRQGGGEPAVAAAVERPRSAAVGAKAVSEEERAEDEALDFAFAAHLDEDDDDDAAAAAAALGDDAAADDESDDDDADAFGGLDELAETAAVRPSAVGPPKPKSPLTATVYTAAMGVCARGAKLGACERLLGMMRRDEVTPTDVTMATLVHACAQAGDWRRALDFLDEAERAGSDGGARRAAEAGADGGAPLAPAVAAAPSAVSLHAHGSALRACAKAGEHGLVLDLFERMKARGLTPNSYCYSQAILACEQAGSVRLARALLDEMPANGVPPNIFCFTAAVQVCAARGAFNAALGLVDRMCADGPKPTVVTYNVLLRGAIGAGQLENAAKILDQMPKLGAEPDAYSFSMVVNGYAASGDVKEALRWLKRMPERFVTAITYHGLIAALCEAGDTKGALAQLAAMRKVGLVPLPRTMRLLLEGFGADQLDD